MHQILNGKSINTEKFSYNTEYATSSRKRSTAKNDFINITNSKSATNTTDDDHYNPTVRLLNIKKSSNGACGFHLTRSKWDPYPWVSGVDAATPAQRCGLKAGDCVLEVNGEDVLGLRIVDIAKLAKANTENVTLLLWSSGMDANCDPESLCCGPMPLSLQRLSVIMQHILSIVECPVCLDTIPPPAMQCQNGHLLCVNCRIRAEKCPVCRDRYTPRRALIAEQIYTAITQAFNLCSNEDKLRQRLFGPNARPLAPTAVLPTMVVTAAAATSSTSVVPPRNRLLAKLLGKSCSMDNLATPSTVSCGNMLSAGSSTPSLATTAASTNAQSATNQLHVRNHSTTTLSSAAATAVETAASAPAAVVTATTCSATLPTNVMFKHFSLSTNDLSHVHQQQQQHQQQLLPPIAIPRCPSLSSSNSSTHLANTDVANATACAVARLDLLSPLFLDKRRPCSSLTASVECITKGFRLVEPDVAATADAATVLATVHSSTGPTVATPFEACVTASTTALTAATFTDALVAASHNQTVQSVDSNVAKTDVGITTCQSASAAATSSLSVTAAVAANESYSQQQQSWCLKCPTCVATSKTLR